MSHELMGLAGFGAMFALLILRVPIGISMGIVGVAGVSLLTSWDAAFRMLGTVAIRSTSDYAFGIIPMFLLMGTFVTQSGISRELYRAANAFVGHRPGGLGLATIAACGGFSSISGSAVATAATFSSIAYPEMRNYQYPKSFAAGVIAAGGTLGILIPPSTILAIYGVITQQDIGKLFIAGILPGVLAASLYMATVSLIARLRPEHLPKGPRVRWAERLNALRDVWATLLLFGFVIGGLYGGVFTPTEAGAMGAMGALLLGLARRRLDLARIRTALVDATRVTATIFTLLIGAMIFGYFLALTQAPQKIAELLSASGLGPYGILVLILVGYVLLGSIMDEMAMIVLTLPVVFPVITGLGFDPIWFGIILVVVVEIGIISPPIGINLFVIQSVVRDLTLRELFIGVAPFVVTDIVRLAILVAFPAISLFLPGLMR